MTNESEIQHDDMQDYIKLCDSRTYDCECGLVFTTHESFETHHEVCGVFINNVFNQLFAHIDNKQIIFDAIERKWDLYESEDSDLLDTLEGVQQIVCEAMQEVLDQTR